MSYSALEGLFARGPPDGPFVAVAESTTSMIVGKNYDPRIHRLYIMNRKLQLGCDTMKPFLPSVKIFNRQTVAEVSSAVVASAYPSERMSLLNISKVTVAGSIARDDKNLGGQLINKPTIFSDP